MSIKLTLSLVDLILKLAGLSALPSRAAIQSVCRVKNIGLAGFNRNNISNSNNDKLI